MTPAWVIRLTIVLVTVWAVILVASPDGLDATPMHSLYTATGSSRWLLVFLMFAASAAAFVGEQLKPSFVSLAHFYTRDVLHRHGIRLRGII